MSQDSDRPSKLTVLQGLLRVFTPSAPVSRKDLFRGRFDQIVEVATAIQQPGRQVILYGERGVGKTSLANVITDLVYPAELQSNQPSVRINCTTTDTFKSIWEKVFKAANIPLLDSWQYQSPDPDEIRVALAAVTPPRLVVLDEFDRIEDDLALSLMSDTIKALSDHDVPTKVMIVGVAMSIDQLIGEHESVQRALAEVLMPRMEESELAKIIQENLQTVSMSIEPEALGGIVRLAEGLPAYAHLLGLSASKRAIEDDRYVVGIADARNAVELSVKTHSLMKNYQLAIQSPRRENLFVTVLTSCALAEKNRLGQFTAGAVRAPIKKLTGTAYDIPAFARHLGAFTEANRGSVLVREGQERRYTYRFRNPLLQPFSVMAALSEGRLPDSYVQSIFRPLDDQPTLV